MGVMTDGFREAFRLLVTLDDEVLGITLRTVQVSGTSTLISVLLGIPAGTVVALRRFWGRGFLVSLINFGMGLAPVVVGLAVWLCFTRYGPLGMLDMLYTPTAMIGAQTIIAFPVVTGLTLAGIQSINPKLRSANARPGRNEVSIFTAADLGSETKYSRSRYRRFWQSHKRGRSIHDGWWKHSRLHTGAYDGHSTGGLQRPIRTGHCPQRHSSIA